MKDDSTGRYHNTTEAGTTGAKLCQTKTKDALQEQIHVDKEKI